jgi:hypothetical protein
VKFLAAILFGLGLTSCATVTKLPDSQLVSGFYDYKAPGDASSKYSKVYLEVKEDSTVTIPVDSAGDRDAKPSVGFLPGQVYRKPSLDLDVMVVLFKYRPGKANLPSQLTTDFNGNMFFGYRVDRYKMDLSKTPLGGVRRVRQRALSFGGFVGLGTSFISPWTTNNQTTDEYNGFVVSHGLSGLMGIGNLTVGLGVGWDNLLDRDKDIWIYQNTAWYGLTLSLNLN